MAGHPRVRWSVALAVAVLLVAVATNDAAARSRFLTATGSLTYTWQGDVAHGCATAGVCGVQGELILRPGAGSQVIPIGPQLLNLVLDYQSAVRVRRDTGGPTGGECTEPGSTLFSSLTIRLPVHGPAAATMGPGPSSGRCAGPRAADLGGTSFPVRRMGAGFDLSGRQSFTAGPFTGAVVSTLRLTPETPPANFGGSFFSSSSGPGRVTVSHPLFESVHLDYRVTTVSGSLQSSFRGADDSSCQILDTCGVNGLLAFAIQPPRTLSVDAFRRVSRRVGARSALAAFRRGQLVTQGFSPAPGQVSETYDWPGVTGCSDSLRVPSVLLNFGAIGVRRAAAVVPVTLQGANADPGAESLRTHCPGPADSDVVGAGDVLARGSVTTAQLLAKRTSLVVSSLGDFSGLGYVGSRSGSIRLDLTLVKVRAGTNT